MLAILNMVTKYDTTDIEGNESPFLYITVRRIASVTSLVQYQQYQARYPDVNRAQMNYNCFIMLNTVAAHVSQSLGHEPSIHAASSHSTIGILVESATLASNALDAGFVTISSIILGTNTIEVSLLFQNSEFHKQAMVKSNRTIIDVDQGTGDMNPHLLKIQRSWPQ